MQEGKTALMLAAQEGHGAVVELLMNKEGVELNARDKVSELSAYCWRGLGRFDHDSYSRLFVE